MGCWLIAVSQSRRGWVFVQQQEGPHIPRGEGGLNYPCRLHPSGRQTGWGTSQGRGVQGVTSPADSFISWVFLWGWYLHIISISSYHCPEHAVRTLNGLFLSDGDISATNYYVLSCIVPPLVQNLSLHSWRVCLFLNSKEKMGVIITRHSVEQFVNVISCSLYLQTCNAKWKCLISMLYFPFYSK